MARPYFSRMSLDEKMDQDIDYIIKEWEKKGIKAKRPDVLRYLLTQHKEDIIKIERPGKRRFIF